MVDEVERTQNRIEAEEAAWGKALRYEIPEGKPGDCDECGEWSSRLIDGMCVPCRDKRGM